MSFNLVLDEPAERDTVEEHEGLQFIVSNRMYEQYKGFTIALKQRGNQAMLEVIPDSDSQNPNNGGSSCGSCSSCG